MKSARMLVCVIVVAAVWLSVAVPRADAADDLKPEAVLKAIEKGKRFLLNTQKPDGTWPNGFQDSYPTGATCLATLALLNIGMTPQDPAIKRALDFLRDSKQFPSKTYEAGLQLMVYAAAKDGTRDRARMVSIVKALEDAQDSTSANPGWWSYTLTVGGQGSDHSNAQYAVLGLREAAFAGIPTSRKSWEATKRHWMVAQQADGGWGYGAGEGSPSTGSMSVAGIATMVIADTMLPDDSDVGRDGVPDCCREEAKNLSFDKGMKWLESHFAVGHNTGAGGIGGALYYLYGLERAGRLSGRRFIGNHDWFREGARFLVQGQGGDGQFVSQGHGENDPVVGTSFALLFLSKGMAPVMINKLKFGPPGAVGPKGLATEDWNRHRRDVHNLTDLISGMTKWPKLVTWQVVEMDKAVKGAGVADLLQAPVLFLSGRDAPQLSDKEVDLLREYVNSGGFIFAVCNCNGAGFDTGFRDLIPRLYPKGEAELKKLSNDHPIFRSEHFLVDADINLWGVDFGCRTAIVYSPDDLACAWNKWCVSEPEKRSPELKAMIVKATKIGTNVIAYATSREPPDKLEQAQLADKAAQRDRIEAGLLQVVQLKHTGGWDTAPHALRNMLFAMNDTAGLAAATKPRVLNPSDPNLYNYPIAYMHGRFGFKFNRAERDRLKTYLDNGGVLFADACCSAPQFDKSFRELMTQMYPDKKLTRIPVDHELFKERNGGHDLKQVRRRGSEGAGDKGLLANSVTGEPFLEGIDLDGRFAVIYSKYDISCALEGQKAIACEGYVSADATKLAVNMILYFMAQDLR